MKRQHPYAILRYVSKNFWLLLIPLVRGLIMLSFDFNSWVSGAEWDILVVAVMLGAAVWRWYFTRFEFADDAVRVETGRFIRTDISFPYQSVSAVTAESNPILMRLGAVRLNIDTDAPTGSRSDPDIKLIAAPTDRARLINLLSESSSSAFKGKSGMNYIYKVSKITLVLFSILFSSAISGVILLGTFFTQGGKILGEQLEERLLTAVNDVTSDIYTAAQRIVSNITPAAVSITLAIAAGFIISFVSNLLRHLNFTVARRGSCIFVSSGFFTKRQYFINSRRINCADMRQNLLMKLFGVTSVNVSCTGYGKQKSELPVFVPICSIKRLYDGKNRTELVKVMQRLLPEFYLTDSFITPNLFYIWRFIGPPTALIFLIMIAGFAATIFFQQWHSLIAFMTVLLEIPTVWLFLVKICAYCTNGINIMQKNICIKYCVGYSFHTVTVPFERIAYIAITQTPFQRMNRSCDVVIYTNAEYTGKHRIKGMPLSEVSELINDRFAGIKQSGNLRKL